MRVHSLELQAFGPFAKRATIDFDALSEAGIFLLNGETGAGKTSVLDGICYALYGSLPGVRTGSKSLRSDHAAPDAVPEVICEFSTGGRRFEVTRSPAWERPSARSKNGFTTAQAQSRLRERIDGTWVEKSTRNDEVGQLLTEVLGLDREQFTKVAMLPQGAFAAFLRAKDKDREDLLRSLFDTSDYAMTERILGERLNAARAEAEEAARARTTTLQSLVADAETTLFAQANDADAGETGADNEEGPGQGLAPETGLPPEAREHLQAGQDAELGTVLREHIAATRTALGQARASAEAALAAAQKSRTALDERATRHRQLAELGSLRASHEDRAEEIAALGALLEADARAVGLRPYHQQLLDARTKSDAAHRRLADAVSAIESGEARAALDARDPGFQALLEAARGEQPDPTALGALGGHAGEAAKASRAAAALIEAALPEEAELAQARKDIDALQEDIEAGTHKQAERSTRIQALGEQLPVLRTRNAELAALAESAPGLESAVHAATERRDAVAARTKAEKAQLTAHSAWNNARTGTLEAKERVAELIALRLEQSAAALARELVDGDPCLVCGSTTHPEPATLPDGELIGAQGIEAAQGVLAAAEKSEEKYRAALKKADTALDVGRGKIGELSTEEAEADLLTATGAFALALASGAESAAAAVALGTAETELETLSAALASAATALEVAAARQQAEEAKATKLAARLEKLGRDGQSLSERHEALSAAAKCLETLAGAVHARLDAGTTLEDARLLWTGRLADIGAADTAAWQEQLLDDARRTAEQARVREHNDAAVRIKTLAEAPGIELARTEAAAGLGAPGEDDIEAAGHAVSRGAAARDGLLARDAVLASYAARLETALERLAALAVEAGPVIERFETLKGIADLARGAGENRLKMTLSTYVLAARLESVALAATERLLAMTGQRYSLLHDDTPRGNNKSGLGLQILDSWTGVRRDTQTLSGGESFMASLSLALGLADVIQHSSGGIDIETLFVDEGFGSLDAETLEEVMDALENLRSGGRVIGVVSHVADMKQRITTQLNVHKSRTGSTVSMQAGV
ncbi:SMC family ATPase [Paeniglutamicibacter psychrophenolicus]|uniref:Nuclease SbcCD subunit C n=1 Tax=Paeniglutamicibacter psychrophenolicus TaxID=257454 RepID=A0ABS4WFF4_9MICC|nr:SMC family ATPase [Paeniglutamicibacter psychrophenolicus]MBP2374304.1 exonuclease SbcC [Paeniglutamicibacter psychrophenolicus]